MRALTLTQPCLVASGIKLVENRPRRMIKREDFGKPFAIHASREIDESVYRRIRTIAPEIHHDADQLTDVELALGHDIPWWYALTRATGSVIAVATIDRVVSNLSFRGEPSAPDLGDQARWFFGPIGYVLRDVRALAKPVPCRGHQGFWTLTPEFEAQWLDAFGAQGDSQPACSWRKRAWRVMRPVVERVVADVGSWTAGKVIEAVNAAGIEAKIDPNSKRWRQERTALEDILHKERSLWRAPTDDDRAACEVAIDLVESTRYLEAILLLRDQAPNVLERQCSACRAMPGYPCEEITPDPYPREDTVQTHALKLASIPTYSRRHLIVPHGARTSA
jgi:hypothetical protein